MKKLLALLLFLNFSLIPKNKEVSLWNRIFWKNTNKEQYLYNAVINGNKRKAIAAIKAGADVNCTFLATTRVSLMRPYEKLEKYASLLPSGVIYNNWLDVFDLMVEHNLDINHPDILISLASSKWHEKVKQLINADVDVNNPNKLGTTPLMAASDELMIKLLLDHGALVNKVDNNGQTALHRHAFMGEKDCVILLLEAGANVNTVDNRGNTPLHIVSRGMGGERDAIDIAQALIWAGADITIKNKNGETARQYQSNFFNLSPVFYYLKSLEEISNILDAARRSS